MDGNQSSGLSDSAIRAELERQHPGCQIEFDEVNRAWGVVIRLSATAERYVVGPTLPELVIKLGVEGSEAG
jgi:hypothetical protein